jgi:hypothetical protein
MKKGILAIFFAEMSFCIFAQNAVIKDLTGTVELKPAGVTVFVPATAGSFSGIDPYNITSAAQRGTDTGFTPQSPAGYDPATTGTTGGTGAAASSPGEPSNQSGSSVPSEPSNPNRPGGGGGGGSGGNSTGGGTVDTGVEVTF